LMEGDLDNKLKENRNEKKRCKKRKNQKLLYTLTDLIPSPLLFQIP